MNKLSVIVLWQKSLLLVSSTSIVFTSIVIIVLQFYPYIFFKRTDLIHHHIYSYWICWCVHQKKQWHQSCGYLFAQKGSLLLCYLPWDGLLCYSQCCVFKHQLTWLLIHHIQVPGSQQCAWLAFSQPVSVKLQNKSIFHHCELTFMITTPFTFPSL